jgi:hypothetical protein
MTPEQLRAYLLTNPGLSFAELEAEALELMRDQLRSGPQGFTPKQQGWLLGFFLMVPSQAALEATTAKLPPGLGLSAQITIAGELVLPASLLTDSMQEGDTWAAIADDLVGFEIRFIAPEDFPIPEDFEL